MSEGVRGLLGYLWKYRSAVLAGLAGIVVSDLAQLVVPMLVKHLVDGLADSSLSRDRLTQVTVWILLLALVSLISKFIWRHYLLGASRQAEVDLRRRLLDKALELSVSKHQKTRIGEFIALASNDVSSVQQALAFGILAAFDSLFFSVCALSAMLYLDWRLTLWAVLPFPLLGVFMAVSLRQIYNRYDRVQSTFEDLTEKVRESISGIRVLRAFHQEKGDCRDFEEHNQRVLNTTMDYVRVDATFRPFILLFAGSSTALLLWFGGNRVLTGETTVGDFAAFTAYLAQLTWPMIAAGWMLVLVQRGAASMVRIQRMLDLAPEEPPRPDIEHDFRGGLEVKNLNFSYGDEGFALRDISFSLPPGKSLGIVGEVGSGKTTLLELVHRFQEPPAGTIFLDGVDVNDIPLAQLRRQLSLVPQQPFLFSDTISANLRMADPEADQSRLEEACRQAALHDEVLEFPSGYETLLGERGISLSGGQRQRLCLARALLKPAPVILFDDTLSAVDHETEHEILEHLEKRQGQTRVVISHRLSAVAEMDQILVLDGGRVVASGTHQELLEQPGLYQQLHQLQALTEPT